MFEINYSRIPEFSFLFYFKTQRNYDFKICNGFQSAFLFHFNLCEVFKSLKYLFSESIYASLSHNVLLSDS